MGVPKQRPIVPSHLSDAQIVAYFDGELPRNELDSARAHLESCWTCRSRMGELQNNIDAFLDARTTLLPEESGFSDLRVEQFRQRLARHASATQSEGLPFQQWLARWRMAIRNSGSLFVEYRRAALAVVVSGCLLAVMFSDLLNTRVSADTVLSRAENYEANHLAPVGGVTTTSVRIEKIDRGSHGSKALGTVTLVRDSLSTATYVAARSTSGAAKQATVKDASQIAEPLLEVVMSGGNDDSRLERYLSQEHWVPDLSISQFRRLIDSRGSTQVSARRNHGEFELDYPFAPGHASGIQETLLRVDASDYAATSLSILTGGINDGSEYRFTRTTFSSAPRTLEMAKIFSPFEPSTTSTAPARPLPQLSKPVPVPYASSQATEEEVALAESLHKIDSCLGEEVYIYPMSDGSVLVQGLVDNPARRNAVRDALKLVGGSFRVEVYVPRELRNGSELYKPPDPSVQDSAAVTRPQSATLADLSDTGVPLHDVLYQHFMKPGLSPEDINKQVALFSNEIVTLARQTFLHAWALKRLDQEFAPTRIAGLPANVLQKIEQMREDHRRWISTITKRQAEMLAPVTGPEVMSGVEQVAGAQDTDTLLHLAQEQNELVRLLFTISPQAPVSADSLARLIAVLKHMGA